MAAITASMVKDLRERTGLGMMECKKALASADGDIETAIENLRKSSGMKAAKKASRIAAEGVLLARVSEDSKTAVLVEVNSETDFASRDVGFLDFANKVADHALATQVETTAKLMSSDLENAREALVQKIGENINVRRLQVVKTEGLIASYVHGNKRIGVLVDLTGGTTELAKDIAMHVAALNPQVAKPADMPQELLDKERDIFSAQSIESGKPPEIIEKMIDGRMRKFLSENSLTEQPFVKDPDQTIGKLLKSANTDINGYLRYEVGEGIEKVEEDFAAEVAKQLEGANS